MKNIELILQYGDLSSLINANVTQGVTNLDLTFNAGVAAGTITNTVIADDSTLVCKYMSLHASQYAKLSKRNVINFDEFVSHPITHNRTAEDFSIISNELSLTQIPDKMYITISPQPSEQKPIYSNNLCFPIDQLNIKFNGVAGLLTDRTMHDLYVMSRRNGSQQTWGEFSGTVKINDSAGVQADAISIGSIIVIYPVRDLGLSDMLSASSLGSYSCQVRATQKELSVLDSLLCQKLNSPLCVIMLK